MSVHTSGLWTISASEARLMLNKKKQTNKKTKQKTARRQGSLLALI